MPIRFRCPNCDQLMGIARRKAGALVRCPACRREIAVPAVVEDDSPEPTPSPLPAPVLIPVVPRANLFERDDFDALLKGAASMEAARPVTPLERRPAGTPAASPSVRAEMLRGNLTLSPAGLGSGPGRGGLILTPRGATLFAVAIVVLLALAFALGLVVGRYVL